MITHSALIEKLGGASSLAGALADMGAPIGAPQKFRARIYMWKSNNQIPFRWRPYVRALAEQKGLQVPDDLADPISAHGNAAE